MAPRSIRTLLPVLLPVLLCCACAGTPEPTPEQVAEKAAAEKALAGEVEQTQEAIDAEERADHARRSGGEEAEVEEELEEEPQEKPAEAAGGTGTAPETPPGAKEPAAEMPDLTDILKQLEEIRGLAFKAEVPSEVQDERDFRKLIDDSLEDTFPHEQRVAKLAGLRRLGLVERAMDLGEEYSNALMTQAAAYYNPETGTFYYLMTDMPDDILRTTAAHELVHALQDQHFDLSAMFAPIEATIPRNDDAILAARYLVEGEATYVQTVWQMQHMMGATKQTRLTMADASLQMTANMSLEQLMAMSKLMANAYPEDSSMRRAMDTMDSIPRYFLVPLMDAYLGGARFTSMVRQVRGWKGVSAIYADLPESSEQCLHPEKYLFNRDRPTKLAIPALHEMQGAGWKTADAAIHGESYLRLLLTELGVDRKTAKVAGAGWDGDIYHAFVNDDGAAAIVLMTTWDTEADAREFADAYGTGLRRKYPEFALSETDKSTPGTTVFECGAGAGHGRTVLRGREFFAVEGVSADLAIAVMQRLVAAPVKHVD